MESEKSFKVENQEKQEIKELIAPVEGLVFRESVYFLDEEDFTKSFDAGVLPNNFLHPIIAETNAPVGQKRCEKTLEAKSVVSSGKGCFIEQPTNISGTKFNFVQWKGIGGVE